MQVNVADLKVGSVLDDTSFSSSSALLENAYKKNVTYEIVNLPHSGSACYIENITGCKRYCQTEVLIKRNAKFTVIGDIRSEKVTHRDGTEYITTIIPVVVN